jgi:hypothetical protein
MPLYRHTIIISDPSHWDRPLAPYSFVFRVDSDDEARAMSKVHTEELRVRPAVDGIHFDRLEEGKMTGAGVFVSERVVFREHDDEGCLNMFCVGYVPAASR